MGNATGGSTADGRDCEECGGSDAQPVRVTYDDGQTETLTLCNECLDEFRTADLVEETSVPNGQDIEN